MFAVNVAKQYTRAPSRRMCITTVTTAERRWTEGTNAGIIKSIFYGVYNIRIERNWLRRN